MLFVAFLFRRPFSRAKNAYNNTHRLILYYNGERYICILRTRARRSISLGASSCITVCSTGGRPAPRRAAHRSTPLSARRCTAVHSTSRPAPRRSSLYSTGRPAPRRSSLYSTGRPAPRCSSLYSTTRGKRAGAPFSVSTGRTAPRRSSLYSTTRGTRAGAPLSVSTGLISRSRSFSLDGLSTGRATALAASTRTLCSLRRRWWRNRARKSSRVPVVVVAGVPVAVVVVNRHRCRHRIIVTVVVVVRHRLRVRSVFRPVRIGSRPRR